MEGGDKLAVSIYDGYTETRLDVREGVTVGAVLEKAEIVLDGKDAVVPSLDTEITEDGTDISIKRGSDTDNMPEKKGTDGDKEESGKVSVSTKAEDAQEGKGDRAQADEDAKGDATEEPKIVSKEKVYDCDGSGHGYYYIKWSDGREEYEDF